MPSLLPTFKHSMINAEFMLSPSIIKALSLAPKLIPYPKLVSSGYNLFLKEQLEKLKTENSSLAVTERVKLAASKWRTLSLEEKEAFNAKKIKINNDIKDQLVSAPVRTRLLYFLFNDKSYFKSPEDLKRLNPVFEAFPASPPKSLYSYFKQQEMAKVGDGKADVYIEKPDSYKKRFAALSAEELQAWKTEYEGVLAKYESDLKEAISKD